MEPIDIILNSIQNNTQQVDALSHNIANANTPGYVGSTVFSMHLPGQLPSVRQAINADITSPVQVTNRKLDIAMNDKAFLLVQGDESPVLTRYGRFYIDPQGMLTHVSGKSVLGSNGPISVAAGTIEISKDGVVYLDGERVDTLLTAIPSDVSHLKALGGGLFESAGAINMTTPNVKQGAINGASVSVSHDMIRLIELSRHTQSLQKAVLAMDQASNAGINELGKRQ